MCADVITTNPGRTAAEPVPEVTLWQRLSFRAMRAVLGLLLLCLGLKGLYAIGRGFGTLEWMVNYKRRRKFRKRLKQVLGEQITPQQRRRQARRFFMRTRCDKIFYLIFDKIPREKALGLFHIKGRQLMDKALETGNGCFVAMSHHGAHHVVGLLMCLFGYKAAAVRDPNEGGIRKFVQRLYDRRYPEIGRMRILSADGFPRHIYRCLRDNYALGAALDAYRTRDQAKHTTTVSILGREREVIDGTVRIAIRCKAAVLQGFVISGPDFRYRLDLLGPLVPDSVGTDDSPSVQSAMDAYARNIEVYIREYPDHLSRV